MKDKAAFNAIAEKHGMDANCLAVLLCIVTEGGAVQDEDGSIQRVNFDNAKPIIADCIAAGFIKATLSLTIDLKDFTDQ